eukprot:309382-Prorocentrum_minimum.AAC.2
MASPWHIRIHKLAVVQLVFTQYALSARGFRIASACRSAHGASVCCLRTCPQNAINTYSARAFSTVQPARDSARHAKTLPILLGLVPAFILFTREAEGDVCGETADVAAKTETEPTGANKPSDGGSKGAVHKTSNLVCAAKSTGSVSKQGEDPTLGSCECGSHTHPIKTTVEHSQRYTQAKLGGTYMDDTTFLIGTQNMSGTMDGR